jgi:hypothetical protein
MVWKWLKRFWLYVFAFMCKNMTTISKDYLLHTIIGCVFTLIFESIKIKVVHTIQSIFKNRMFVLKNIILSKRECICDVV